MRSFCHRTAHDLCAIPFRSVRDTRSDLEKERRNKKKRKDYAATG